MQPMEDPLSPRHSEAHKPQNRDDREECAGLAKRSLPDAGADCGRLDTAERERGWHCYAGRGALADLCGDVAVDVVPISREQSGRDKSPEQLPVSPLCRLFAR